VNTLITYYSYSGHTDKAVQAMAGALRRKGEVAIQRLKPKKEIDSFAAQARAAFFRRRAELEPGINFDLSRYDLVIIATPVWAFAPAPAVNTFLDNMTGVTAKKAIILVTSGSGAGVGKCFRNIEDALKNKGAFTTVRINIKDTKCEDEALVVSELEKTL